MLEQQPCGCTHPTDLPQVPVVKIFKLTYSEETFHIGQGLALPSAWWYFSPVKIAPPCLHLQNIFLCTCITLHSPLSQQIAGGGTSFIWACFLIPGGKSPCKLQGWPSENEALNYSSLVFNFRFTIWWEDKLDRLIREPWNSVRLCAMQS